MIQKARRLLPVLFAVGTALLPSACLLAPAELPDDQMDLFALRALLNAGSGGTSSRLPLVGLERHYDVNGDGFDDLLLGDDTGAANEGRVLIYYGNAGGIADYNVGAGGTGADTVLVGPVNARFGRAVALGDINGDGYADAVVADESNANAGAVYIFYSRGSAGIAGQNLQSGGSAGTTLTGENTGQEFGTSVNVGDFNGDGFADVIVHAPQYNGAAGRLYVFLSRGSSGIASAGAAGADIIVSGTNNNRFQFTDGQTALLADVNGDGLDDVLACNIDLVGTQVHVLIFHGRTASSVSIDLGAGGAADQSIDGIVGLVSCTGGLDVGDFNGDGYADILTGMSGFNSNQGRADVLLSGGSSGFTGASLAAADTTLLGPTTCDFGTRVSAVDINGDGIDDAWTGEGRIACVPENYYAFHGTAGGIASQDLSGAGTADTVLTDAVGGLLGRVGAGDFNGDGFEDTVFSDGIGTQDVWIFYGRTGGIPGGTTATAGTALSNVTGVNSNLPR